MATATPRKQRTRVRSVLLIGYGILALGISVALAGTTLFRPTVTNVSGTTPGSGISVIVPSATDTALPTPRPEASVTPGQDATPTGVPESTPTVQPSPLPRAQPTAVSTGAQSSSPSSDNPFGLPLWMLQVLFAFTTLSGVASILRFMWDTLIRFAKLFQR